MSARRLAALFVALLLGAGTAAPWIAGRADIPSVDPTRAQSLPPGTRVIDEPAPGGGFTRRPVPSHAPSDATRRMWLGTDHQGRDLLARTLTGARVSLLVALCSAAVTTLLGAAIGLLAAAAPRRVAALVALVADALLGMPRLLILLALGLVLGGSILGTSIAIALASFVFVAKLVEERARVAWSSDAVLSARAIGASTWRIALGYVARDAAPVARAAAPLVATRAVLLESTLAYLGAGLAAGGDSWGRIIAEGQRHLSTSWWTALAPGVLLLATALAFHALADVTDPSSDEAARSSRAPDPPARGRRDRRAGFAAPST
jgi:peptide/nickel transport system permease protein